MSEELKPESTELIILPIEDQISQELVKANVTEAIIADLRERLLPLKIAGIDDKETYLIVQSGRKECKALRVAAKKICTNGREQAVAISKAWIAKEKEVTGQIGEVEDYLEVQEKEYETEVAKEKEARKRKQEEQLIMRQQTLAGMGVLYADGYFSIGDVSFEFSAIKESEEDIWEESILPKFKEEYEKVEADRIAQDKIKADKELWLQREQERIDRERNELDEKEAELKKEAERQANEAKAKEEAKNKTRIAQLHSIGLKPSTENGHLYYIGYDCAISHLDISGYDDDNWFELIGKTTEHILAEKEKEHEEKRKEQDRKDLQAKRLNEVRPYEGYGIMINKELCSFSEDEYQDVLKNKKAAWERNEEEKRQAIAEKAAKEERERIEEEQRQAEVKRKRGLKEFRIAALAQYNTLHTIEMGDLGEMSDDKWMILITMTKQMFDDLKRKQEEERKAEELLQASEKVKWQSMMEYLNGMVIHPMRGGLYRKKVAILKEKLEEIKAL